MNKCPFCRKLKNGDTVHKSERIFAVKDEFPVTEGHTLVLPVRCIPNFFYLSPEEHASIIRFAHFWAESIMMEDPTVDGYNIGWNVGGTAGQTIEHAHCHLIPRREGDCENPTGGVRNVIPEKGDYLK